MTEPKFRDGDKAYDLRVGVVELVALPGHSDRQFATKGQWAYSYRADGREKAGHKNPMLLTLEDARKRGYDVPAEPARLSAEAQVLAVIRTSNVEIRGEGVWDLQVRLPGSVLVTECGITGLEGKVGKLTFEESDPG